MVPLVAELEMRGFRSIREARVGEAWRRFASLKARAMPAPLVRATRPAVALARRAPL